jgi:hypothetical protein
MCKYNLSAGDNTKILIDASAAAVITAFKANLDEQIDYLEVIGRRKKNQIRDPTRMFPVMILWEFVVLSLFSAFILLLELESFTVEPSDPSGSSGLSFSCSLF